MHAPISIANSTTGIRANATSEETPKEILISVSTSKDGITGMKTAKNTINIQNPAFNILIAVEFICITFLRYLRYVGFAQDTILPLRAIGGKSQLCESDSAQIVEAAGQHSFYIIRNMEALSFSLAIIRETWDKER